jgi:putative ABC transport system permease protein
VLLVAALAAVAGVLLIACANIASLTMARATARRAETAVRAALGAGAGRVVRPFVIESCLLAAAGGVLGVLAAAWSLDLLVVLAMGAVPRVEDTAVDGAVLVTALALSVLAAVLTAAAPSLHAVRRGRTAAFLPGGGSRMSVSPFGHALVIGQTALAVVVVAGAALLLKSVSRLEGVDPGFDPTGVLKFRVELPAARYPASDWVRIVSFYERLLDEMRALPGVTGAAAAFSHPLEEGFTTTPDVLGRDPLPAGTEPEAHFRPVTLEYFQMLRIPILRGRPFEPADHRSPLGRAVINEAMARQFFGDGDPLGRRFRIPWPAGTWPGVPDTYEIVGIVRNERFSGLDAEPQPAMYFPHAIAPMSGMNVMVRAQTDPGALVAPIRRRLAALDHTLPMFDEADMTDVIGESMAARRFALVLLGVFALLAFALAMVGIYGTTAYAVSRRVKEIGIRVALGAERRTVVAMIVTHALGRIVAGIALGLAGAALATPFIRSLLYDIDSTDPSTFAAVGAGLALAGLVAAWLPARAAGRVDPAATLRAF